MSDERPQLRDRIPTLGEVEERLEEAFEPAKERIADFVEEVRPKLRGWLHLWTVPAVLLAGLTLTVLAPTALSRAGAAVYTFTSVLLFGVSAVYNRGGAFWDAKTDRILQKLDHSNIFLLIAGSTTPFALGLLHGTPRVVLLSLMWGGCFTGIALKLFWRALPRSLSTAFYIVLGWLPLAFTGEFAKGATELGNPGAMAIGLIATGGLLYTIGGVIYGVKRPNPWPETFGFHEVFHLFTILAFACHFAAVALVSYAV